jgi:hypothetical protein
MLSKKSKEKAKKKQRKSKEKTKKKQRKNKEKTKKKQRKNKEKGPGSNTHGPHRRNERCGCGLVAR